MTDETKTMSALFSACWNDEALKARFMSDPKAVLTEYDIDIPDEINVNVVENTENTINITIPMAPQTSDKLSDQELGMVAGGTGGKLQCTGGWGASICYVCTQGNDPQC
jgi:hypothetical protein